MKTAADEARGLHKKYPYADRSKYEERALEDSLQDLMKRQEQIKQQMQIGQQANQFAYGGDPAMDEEEFIMGVLDSYEPQPKVNQHYWGKPLQEEEGSTKWDEFMTFLKNDYNKNGSTYLNTIAGLPAMYTNLRNRRDVKSPKLITPTPVVPTVKPNYMDLSSYRSALSNELASTRHSYMQSGADFDTVSAGVGKVNQGYATALGDVYVEQQKLNNAESARVDDSVNKAQFFNAQRLDQAQIDQAARGDIADKQRRDYLTALSQNVQTILTDSADRKYAQELEPFYKQLADISAMLKTKIES